MMEEQTNWKTDWAQFVHAVADDIGNGMSSIDVTDKYCDQPVEWTGTISSIRFDDDPAVNLQMPPIRVDMPDGRYGVVDYLNLVIGEENVNSWRSVTPGMTVRFRTSVRKGGGPFPGLEWADLGDKEGYVSVGTNESSLVKIVDMTQ